MDPMAVDALAYVRSIEPFEVFWYVVPHSPHVSGTCYDVVFEHVRPERLLSHVNV